MSTPIDAAAWEALLQDRLGLALPADRLREFERWLGNRMTAEAAEAWRLRLAGLPLHHDDWQAIVRTVTIGETYFWRHERHMRALETVVLPDLIRQATASDRPIVVWSAACASGEELYSVAMLIDRVFPQERHRFRLVGTDINQASLDRAMAGRYGRGSLRALADDAWQRQYVERQADGSWQVLPILRQGVQFALVELTGGDPAATVPALAAVDLILCRNVAIYFDAQRRRQLLTMLGQRLRRDGWLLMGDTEVDGLVRERFHLFDSRTPSLFQARQPERRPAPAPAVRPQKVVARPASPLARDLRPAVRLTRPALVPTPPVAPRPAPAGPTPTAAAAAWISTDGLPAAKARMLALAADREVDAEMQLALAYLALAEGQAERAVPSLQRALLLSGQPLLRSALLRVREAGAAWEWSDHMLMLAQVLERGGVDGGRV